MNGRNRKERSEVRAKFIGFYATPALKRDLWRLARSEDRTLSKTVCGILRLGIGRYFELASDTIAVQQLRKKMEDAFETSSG